jgi:hypothetical protein
VERQIPPQRQRAPRPVSPADIVVEEMLEVAHHPSETGVRRDAPTMSEVGVEIDVADGYRLPRETSRALLHVMMAVRERKLGPEKGAA